MKIGGFQKVSLIDYPGMICATVFTQGCNFRCPYCHNPELVDPNLFGECQPEDAVISFLEKRRGKLDAVSITGGEPTLQQDLIDFVKRVRKLKYAVKLDTNGSHPEILQKMIEGGLVDYFAMDIKGPLKKYETLSQVKIDENLISESIGLIMASGVPYEFRTTVLKSRLSEQDLLKIGHFIKGATLYVLQEFVPSKTLDRSYTYPDAYDGEALEAIKRKLQKSVKCVTIR
jgi:pyruvate formate lyase activating enzyme